VIAIAIRHSSEDPVATASRVTKNHVWDASDNFPNAELMHRRIPQVRRFTPFSRLHKHHDQKKEEFSLFADMRARL
jgi:hypothetical protein